jgi:protein-S-isoprenylcysteine O-methyltransferase Ste14
MSAENSTAEQTKEKPNLAKGILKRARQILFTLLLIGGLLFISAGTLAWPMAWVYLGVYVAGVVVTSVALWRTNPELIAERAERRPDTKQWDKNVTLLATPLFFAIYIVCGLDKRFGWTPPLPPAVQLAALLLYLLGSGLAIWAMVTNAYFATTVRIQDERGHQVVSNGPYRIVRHPGYSGWGLGFLVTPPLLGSLWGLIPAGLNCVAFIIRTALEDRTLQDELAGYRDYAQKVRYRLVPGIW